MHNWLVRGLIVTLLGAWATGLRAQPDRLAYDLSPYLVQMPVGCGDDVGRSEPYVVVKRLDPELEDQIDVVERKIKAVVGFNSIRKSESTVDDLAEREKNSRAAPLSEAEKGRLASLREARKAHEAARPRRKDTIEMPELPPELRDDADDFPDDDELEGLESRVSLSEAEKKILEQGRGLLDERSRLNGRLRVTSSPDDPKTIVVYPSDDIEVVIWENDFFADDRCFSTIVTLDRDTLDKGFAEVDQRAAVQGRAVRRVLLLLRFVLVQ